MLGRSHRFLDITSTFWGVNVPCSRTQHGLTRMGLEPPTSGSGALTTRPPRSATEESGNGLHVSQMHRTDEPNGTNVGLYEPRCEKNGLRGFRPSPTQARLYSHRRWLEA